MTMRWRDRAKIAIAHAWRLAERLGVHVLPVSFYSQQPNVAELIATRSIWAKPSTLPGIGADPDRQIANLREMCLPYQAEFLGGQAYSHATGHALGPGYGFIEAQALHGIIRHAKPARIIEVGSGVSTYCALAAAELNARQGSPATVTCVEPFPSSALRSMSVTLIQRRAQELGPEVFGSLGAGDILFVDSTHTVRTGGEVNYLILEVLPRLAPGVLVHFHDIYLPYDYSPEALQRYWRQWSETSLIRAYLIDNPRIEIVACLSQLHHERPDDLQQVFPDYKPRRVVDGLFADFDADTAHFPSSLWLRTLG
jgi:methyltransferase family protein